MKNFLRQLNRRSPIFGVPLALAIAHSSSEGDIMNVGSDDVIIPRPVRDTIDLLRRNDRLLTFDLFSSHCDEAVIANLKRDYDKGISPELDDVSPTELANILVRFLAELPDPLIPQTAHDDFLRSIKGQPEEDLSRLELYLNHRLPSENYQLLNFIIPFFEDVVSASDVNNVGVEGIVSFFGPSLFTKEVSSKHSAEVHDLIKFVIENAGKLFNSKKMESPRSSMLDGSQIFSPLDFMICTPSPESFTKDQEIKLFGIGKNNGKTSGALRFPDQKLTRFPDSLQSNLFKLNRKGLERGRTCLYDALKETIDVFFDPNDKTILTNSCCLVKLEEEDVDLPSPVAISIPFSNVIGAIDSERDSRVTSLLNKKIEVMLKEAQNPDVNFSLPLLEPEFRSPTSDQTVQTTRESVAILRESFDRGDTPPNATFAAMLGLRVSAISNYLHQIPLHPILLKAKELEHQIRDWRTEFEQKGSGKPTKDEKRSIRPKVEKYLHLRDVVQTLSALRIQSCWRGYYVRKNTVVGALNPRQFLRISQKRLEVQRQRASRPEAIGQMTYDQLLAEKKAVKSELRVFENDFSKRFSKEPRKMDKEPLRVLYQRYKALRDGVRKAGTGRDAQSGSLQDRKRNLKVQLLQLYEQYNRMLSSPKDTSDRSQSSLARVKKQYSAIYSEYQNVKKQLEL